MLVKCLVLLAALLALAVAVPDHSITGFSSGAFFAVQYQYAHSSRLTGAAIFAGGPYWCAQDSLEDALVDCMSVPFNLHLEPLNAEAQSLAKSGDIDPLEGLAKNKVFLFSGEVDYTVNPGVVHLLEKQYAQMNVTDVQTEYSIGDAHGFPTLNYGNPCYLQETPFINNCNYDGAGNALKQVIGNIKPAGTAQDGNIVPFNQSKYISDGTEPSALSLADTGYAYVPSACQNGNCHVHLVLHGCGQQYEKVGDVFVKNAGYNGYAESNNLVILYPQATATYFNEMSCWDWWGYGGQNYATKSGPQIMFMQNLVDGFLKK
jgi:poly(3-hydroxybutyrate) depolymerase